MGWMSPVFGAKANDCPKIDESIAFVSRHAGYGWLQ